MRKDEIIRLANDVADETFIKNSEVIQKELLDTLTSASGKTVPEQIATAYLRGLRTATGLSTVAAANLIDKLGLVQIDTD